MSKLKKIKNGEYIGGDKYTITPEASGKSKVVFNPDSVITEPTPVGAEVLNEMQLNGTYTLNTNRIVDGQKEVYVATLEGFTEFDNPDLNLILKINSNNSSNNVYLRLNNIDYQILNCGIGNLISGRFINAKKEGNFIKLLSLEKTDSTENDSNKLFSAKGALNLFNTLTTNFTDAINTAKEALRLDITKKISKSGDTATGTITSTASIALKIVSDTYKDITYHQRYGRVARTAMSTEQVNGESKGTYFVGLQEADSSDFLKKFTIKADGIYEDGVRMYSPLNKPSKTDVGLGNIQNYPITDSTDDPSSDKYCSALAVKNVKDIAKKYIWDEITGSGVDLNTIVPSIDKTMCIYRIGTSTIATEGTNFPSTSAGVLECIRSYSTHVVQNYYDNQGKVFTRFRSGTETWTNWVEITAVTSKLDKGIYTGNAQDLKNLIDTKFNSSGGNITGIPTLKMNNPYIYFWDTRSGASEGKSFIGFGSAINRFQISNAHSGKALVLEANGKLTYDNKEVRNDSNNAKISRFYKNASGTTSGNYASGYNIDIFKDNDRNDCNMVFSTADNSLQFTESGTYEVILKTYLNNEWSESQPAYNTSMSKLELIYNNATILMYSEQSDTRNAVCHTLIDRFATGDKLYLKATRINTSSNVLLYNGKAYNSITFRRLGD